jgi:hypothetical protein
LFNQANLVPRTLGSKVIGPDRDINHTFNIFIGNLMSPETVDDVLDVVEARPKARSLLVRLNKESRDLEFLASRVTNADLFFFVATTLYLGERLPAIGSPSSNQDSWDFKQNAPSPTSATQNANQVAGGAAVRLAPDIKSDIKLLNGLGAPEVMSVTSKACWRIQSFGITVRAVLEDRGHSYGYSLDVHNAAVFYFRESDCARQ